MKAGDNKNGWWPFPNSKWIGKRSHDIETCPQSTETWQSGPQNTETWQSGSQNTETWHDIRIHRTQRQVIWVPRTQRHDIWVYRAHRYYIRVHRAQRLGIRVHRSQRHDMELESTEHRNVLGCTEHRGLHMGENRQEYRPGRMAWILTLQFTSCVTLGKLFDFSWL